MKKNSGSPAPFVGPSVFPSMFVRSLFIQTGWNYERSQNLGFIFSLMPALKKIYQGSEDALRAAVLRHLTIFNTQPYMAGFVLGNVAKMEEVLSQQEEPGAAAKNMEGVKQALASSFASIGDRVFWGRLKPMTTQICLIIWMCSGFYGWLFPGAGFAASPAVIFAGPLAGMAVYGAFAGYLRWHGLQAGYACGGGANCALDAMDWKKIIRGLSVTGFALSLMAALAAVTALIVLSRGSGWGLAGKISVVAGVLALQRLARKSGRSIFFAMGVILAVSITVFNVLMPACPPEIVRLAMRAGEI